MCDRADLYHVSLPADVQQRCPRCAALVRPGVPWCTLCYADLRPVASNGPAATPSDRPLREEVDPLTAPLALLEAPAQETRLLPAPDLPAHEAAAAGDEASPRWPCHRCGASVPIDDGICNSCGAVFLEGVSRHDPVLQRFGTVSTQAKAAIMIGGSLGLAALFLGLMYLVGLLF